MKIHSNRQHLTIRSLFRRLVLRLFLTPVVCLESTSRELITGRYPNRSSQRSQLHSNHNRNSEALRAQQLSQASQLHNRKYLRRNPFQPISD